MSSVTANSLEALARIARDVRLNASLAANTKADQLDPPAEAPAGRADEEPTARPS